MSTIQSWAGLPDDIKRQAAPDMLAGKGWYWVMRLVEDPGADELRRWAGIAPQSPQVGAESVTSITAAEPGINARIARTREGKRQAVDSALTANPEASNREIARSTGTTHPFVALRRRLRGNVTG